MNQYTAEIRIDRPLSIAAIRFHLEKELRDRLGNAFDPTKYQVQFSANNGMAIARMVPVSEFDALVQEIQFAIEWARATSPKPEMQAAALRALLGDAISPPQS